MQNEELEEKVKEMKLLLRSQQVTFDAILKELVTIYGNEAVQYQEHIQGM